MKGQLMIDCSDFCDQNCASAPVISLDKGYSNLHQSDIENTLPGEVVKSFPFRFWFSFSCFFLSAKRIIVSWNFF